MNYLLCSNINETLVRSLVFHLYFQRKDMMLHINTVHILTPLLQGDFSSDYIFQVNVIRLQMLMFNIFEIYFKN